MFVIHFFFSTSSAFALLSSIFLCIIYLRVAQRRSVCGQHQIMFGTEFVLWVHWDLHFAQTAISFGRRIWMIEFYIIFVDGHLTNRKNINLWTVMSDPIIWTLSRWITLVVSVRRKRNRASDYYYYYYMHNRLFGIYTGTLALKWIVNTNIARYGEQRRRSNFTNEFNEENEKSRHRRPAASVLRLERQMSRNEHAVRRTYKEFSTTSVWFRRNCKTSTCQKRKSKKPKKERQNFRFHLIYFVRLAIGHKIDRSQWKWPFVIL